MNGAEPARPLRPHRPPPQPDERMGWGAWVLVAACILAVNLLGDALGDAADPAYQTH